MTVCFLITSSKIIKKFLFDNQKVSAFTSIDKWKDYVSQFDFLLGSRVHGAVLALNSKPEGVVAFVSQGDIRAFEMTKLLKIPYCDFLTNDVGNKSVE